LGRGKTFSLRPCTSAPRPRAYAETGREGARRGKRAKWKWTGRGGLWGRGIGVGGPAEKRGTHFLLQPALSIESAAGHAMGTAKRGTWCQWNYMGCRTTQRVAGWPSKLGVGPRGGLRKLDLQRTGHRALAPRTRHLVPRCIDERSAAVAQSVCPLPLVQRAVG